MIQRPHHDIVVREEVGAYQTGERSIIAYPRGYKAGTLRPVISVLGGGAKASHSSGRAAVLRLASYGMLAGVFDLGNDGVNWLAGNSTIRARITAARDYLISLGGRPDKVLFSGGSGAAMSVLAWAMAVGRKNVAAIFISIPAVDPWNGVDAATRAQAEASWGGKATFDAAQANWNPVKNPGLLAGIPMRLWYSSNDTVAYPNPVRQLAQQLGPEARALNFGPQAGNGHAVSPNLSVEAQPRFFARYLRD